MKKHTFKLILMTLLCMALFVTSLPFSVSAEDATEPPAASTPSNASVSVGSASGKAGDTVTVNVDLTQNPGVIAMTLDVDYDEKQLELVSASNSGVLNGYNSPSEYGSGTYRLNWNNALATTDNTNTGTVATLTFKLKEDCDKASVNVSGKGYNSAVNSVNVSGGKGTITNTNPTTTTTTTKPTTTKPTTTKPSTTKKPTTTSSSATRATTAPFTRSFNEENTYPVDFELSTTEEESTTDLISLWETTEWFMTEPATEESTTQPEEEQKESFMQKFFSTPTQKILAVLIVAFLIAGIAIIISMVVKSKG